MKENKNVKLKLSTVLFVLFLLILVIAIVCVLITNSKNKNNIEVDNEKNNQNVVENAIDDERQEAEEMDGEIENFENLEVKYEYQSADNSAAEGNPAILKIYEINEDQIKFEYNKGFNLDTSTIDREIKGIAQINAENKYEYKDLESDFADYTMEFEILSDYVVLKEYKYGELFASINLYLVTGQPILTEEVVKIALTNYYELKSAANCDNLLDILVEKGSLNYDSSQNYYMNDGTIVTNIQKSDYKNAMLEYVSENEYLNNWNILFEENVEGKLIKLEGGGNEPIYTIEEINLVEYNHYLANISYVIDASDDDVTYYETVEVYISSYNNYYVIDKIKTVEITELELGNYTVNEIRADEAGVTNDGCGVELKENNEFIIYMGWGAWHNGKYKIEENQLICSSTVLEWDGGAGPGSKSTDVIFTFNIVSENKLQLAEIVINDTKNEKLVYKDGLEIGMTYSRK